MFGGFKGRVMCHRFLALWLNLRPVVLRVYK